MKTAADLIASLALKAALDYAKHGCAVIAAVPTCTTEHGDDSANRDCAAMNAITEAARSFMAACKRGDEVDAQYKAERAAAQKGASA